MFCSKDECHSYKEKWPTCANKGASGHIEPNEYDQENKHTRSHACKFQPVNFPLSQSQNINKFGSGKACFLSPKPRRKYAQKRVSDQLIAPTVTSLAKIGGHEQKKEDRPKSASARPLPERAVMSSVTHLLLLLSKLSLFCSHFSSQIKVVMLSIFHYSSSLLFMMQDNLILCE